jgi:hypothetical protein
MIKVILLHVRLHKHFVPFWYGKSRNPLIIQFQHVMFLYVIKDK